MSICILDLPNEIEEFFDSMARTSGVSKNLLILDALKEWLNLNYNKDTYIDKETVFYLSPEKWDAFLKALDTQGQPNKNLTDLFSESAPWEK